MKIITPLICLLLLVGCDASEPIEQVHKPSPELVARRKHALEIRDAEYAAYRVVELASDIRYFEDTNTGVCFAWFRKAGGDVITYVPREKVEKFLVNKKNLQAENAQ